MGENEGRFKTKSKRRKYNKILRKKNEKGWIFFDKKVIKKRTEDQGSDT
jgi:hypothetical protein